HHRRVAERLARPVGAFAPSLGERTPARRAGSALRRARPEPACARDPSGDLARARAARTSRVAGRPVQRADRARGLLPRPACLHAVPLPEHGAALAVPALPRLEHVRRRADRTRAGHHRSRGIKTHAGGGAMKLFLSWHGDLSWDIAVALDEW